MTDAGCVFRFGRQALNDLVTVSSSERLALNDAGKSPDATITCPGGLGRSTHVPRVGCGVPPQPVPEAHARETLI